MLDAAILPPLLEQELLSSYWRRLSAINCQPARRLSLLRLGAAWRRVDPDLPSALGRIHAMLAPHLGLSLDDLITKHTMFPLYAVGRSHEARESLRRRLCSPSLGPSGAGTPRLYAWLRNGSVRCEICDAESEKAWGAAIQHQRYRLLGLGTCGKHSVPLRVDIGGVPLEISNDVTITARRIENDQKIFRAYMEILVFPDHRIATFREELLLAHGLNHSVGKAFRQRHLDQVLDSISMCFDGGLTLDIASSMLDRAGHLAGR